MKTEAELRQNEVDAMQEALDQKLGRYDRSTGRRLMKSWRLDTRVSCRS